jgi:ABC-type transport system substrate-binding protein
MKRLLFVLLASLALAAQGRIIEESFQRDPGPLDFIHGEGHEQAILQALAGDALVGLDTQGRPVPRLALAWSTRGKTTRLRLRGDASFADGTTLKPEDVVWTFQSIQADPTASPTKRGILDGVAVTAAGQDILVTSPRPPERLLRELGRIPIAKKGTASMGSGPFRCDRRGGEWFFMARTHFLHPQIPGFHFRMVPDENGILDALQKGWLHIGVPPARKNLQPTAERREIRQPTHAQAVVWSRQKGALKWLEHWRRDAFPEGFLGAKGRPSRGLWPESLGHPALEIAGDLPAKPGRLELQYAAGDDYLQKVLMALRARAGKDGVDLDLRPVDSALLYQHLTEGKFQLACAMVLFDPHPWAVLEYVEPKGPMNFTGWSHPRLATLLPRLQSAKAPEWRDLQEVWAGDPAALPLLDFTSVVWVDTRLDVSPSPLGLYLTTPGPSGWRWIR